MNKAVFDASVVLALLREEPGCSSIERYMTRAVICTVNLSEVLSKLIQHEMPEDLAISTVTSLGLGMIDFDEELARAAARLSNQAILASKSRKCSLSLGDRACLATAQSLKLPVFTADRDWLKLNIGLDIRAIR